MFHSRSGKVLKRAPSGRGDDFHHLDDIATRQRPYSGTMDAMRDHVRSIWPDAKYNNSAGSGFWSIGHLMVAEFWPHRRVFTLWRWRIAKPESGGRGWMARLG